MLPSLQFTDFHKFLVSAGGIACVAAGALPFFLLRTQKTVSTTSKQLSELSPDARTATEVQQSQLLWLLRVWPWVSVLLLLVGITFIAIGGIQWRKRQNVLNEKETAEIKKLDSEREKADAEKEKVYQESIALSRSNKETPTEALESIEEKTSESPSADNDPDDLPTEAASESVTEVERPEQATFDSTQAALTTIMAASQDLAPEARGYIETLGSLELTSQAIRRSLPNASITRNVRIGSTRADFVITTRENDRFDLVIDVRRLTHNASHLSESVRRIQAWAEKVSSATNAIPIKNYRPLSIMVLPEGASSKQIRYLARALTTPRGFQTFAPLTVLLINPAALEGDVKLDVLIDLPPDDSKTRVFLMQDETGPSQLAAES